MAPPSPQMGAAELADPDGRMAGRWPTDDETTSLRPGLPRNPKVFNFAIRNEARGRHLPTGRPRRPN